MTTLPTPLPTTVPTAPPIARPGGSSPPEPVEPPEDELAIQAPPALEPTESGGLLMNAIPMLGSVGSIVLVATMGTAAGGRGLIAAGLFLFATVGFIAVQFDRQRRQRSRQVGDARHDYLRYLATVRATIRAAADRQRQTLLARFPSPDALPAVAAEGSRVWRGDEGGALRVRYGIAAQPLGLRLIPPEGTPSSRTDPVAAAALHRLVATHRKQPDLPAVLDLRTVPRLDVHGAAEPARGLARALICSAAARHAPARLAVAVLADPQHLPHWDWLKWLPHALSTRERDDIGARRMVASSLRDLAPLLPEPGPDGTHLLLVVESESAAEGAGPTGDPAAALAQALAGAPDRASASDPAGVTVVVLRPPAERADGGVRLRLEQITERHIDRASDHRSGHDCMPAHLEQPGAEPMPVRADQCALTTAESFARRLTARPGAATGGGGAGPDGGTAGADGVPTGVMGLLGLGDVHDLEPARLWRPRTGRELLRVPIGHGEGGQPVHLDLKESAQQGMGPHGLIIGATGSGKSELLRTLVLGLTLTHSPEQLNVALVDFKGGATFAGMAELPHVAAVITNLAQELALVDRMQDALAGELVRRQELLRAAGNVASVRDYERARAAGADLAPLPSLLVVVDEFSELLAAKPEFLDLFVAIGRLGRSLGLHLLLASQRLDEGRLRGLDSHLSYRIALRTFSAAESRAVLGTAAAYELPAQPGLGYLKSDPTTLVPFRAGYVSGPVTAVAAEEPRLPGILPFTIAEVRRPATEAIAPVAPAEPATDTESLLDVAVRRVAGAGPAAHPVWLPPLDRPETLDRLPRTLPRLVVAVGTIDRPREQRREALTADLRGAAGHVAVVGAPRSGKTTLLRTIAASLALTTTPQETQLFVLDFGGGGFAPWADVPHVAGVAARTEGDVVRRIVAEVRGILDRRETHFRDHGIDSIETYRAHRDAGRPGGEGDGYGDVFLLVDGWGALRAEFDDLEAEIQQIAARGLAFGVHVVLGTSRWADLRAAMRDLLGTRWELRLGDPLDSEVDRRTAAAVPADRPGRGLTQDGLHFLAALPRLDGDPDAESLAAGVDRLIQHLRSSHEEAGAPKLRLLPERVGLQEVRELQPPAESRRLALGVADADLAAVSLDLDAEPHLLIFGDGRSGKTTALRGLAQEVVRTRSPAEAQLVLVDYRRSLLGEVPEDHLAGYLTSADQAAPALAELADHLRSRLPGPEVTAAQLRSRSWWRGAEVVVLIDDYDLVAAAQPSPVQPLVALLPQARDVGLHLVVARRAGGASRALYDPVLQTLRDLAAPGLLLSGSPDEGPLLGACRPQPAVPGRARLVTRERGAEVVQLAWTDPAA